jgi:hypothetical protein
MAGPPDCNCLPPLCLKFLPSNYWSGQAAPLQPSHSWYYLPGSQLRYPSFPTGYLARPGQPKRRRAGASVKCGRELRRRY